MNFVRWQASLHTIRFMACLKKESPSFQVLDFERKLTSSLLFETWSALQVTFESRIERSSLVLNEIQMGSPKEYGLGARIHTKVADSQLRYGLIQVAHSKGAICALKDLRSPSSR